MAKKTKTMQGAGSRIAPAVALLLLGDTAFAGADEDGAPIPPAVPEPSVLGLLATGVAVGGVVAYIRNKRRK